MIKLPEGINSYQEAKSFLKDSKVIDQWNEPIQVDTYYRLPNGDVYFEHESKLEYPYDDYSLTKSNTKS